MRIRSERSPLPISDFLVAASLARCSLICLSRIRVENEPMANHLDTLLWTHPPGGFVPHCRADHELAGETPVLIDAWNREPVSHQLLINLCPDLPEYFSRFERLIEIVGLEDEDRQKARDRFVYYRDRGFDLHSHNLSQLRS